MFDESYRIAGDTKFFMNCLGINNASFKYIDVDITNYDISGISASQDQRVLKIRNEEFHRVINELFSNRMQQVVANSEKKIRLYNKLYSKRLLWYLIMAIVHIFDWFYRESTTTNKQRI